MIQQKISIRQFSDNFEEVELKFFDRNKCNIMFTLWLTVFGISRKNYLARTYFMFCNLVSKPENRRVSVAEAIFSGRAKFKYSTCPGKNTKHALKDYVFYQF